MNIRVNIEYNDNSRRKLVVCVCVYRASIGTRPNRVRPNS